MKPYKLQGIYTSLMNKFRLCSQTSDVITNFPRGLFKTKLSKEILNILFPFADGLFCSPFPLCFGN